MATHVEIRKLVRHFAVTDADGELTKQDEEIGHSDSEDEHTDLCRLEQEYFLKAIRENVDLADHLRDALNSMRIVLAADRSVREGKAIEL